MKEIFAPRHPVDPGPCFFTIRICDVGKSSIDSEVGRIDLRDIGGVRARDIGKRVYRRRDNADSYWFWQMENDSQFGARCARERGRGERVA